MIKIKPKKVKELIIAIARRIAKKHKDEIVIADDLSERVHGLAMVIGEEVETTDGKNNGTTYFMNHSTESHGMDKLQKDWSKYGR